MGTFLRISAVALLLNLGLNNMSLAAEPALVIKVQSVKQLLSNAEYIGSLFGQVEAAKQVKAFVEETGKGENGFEGIDIDKPVGLYVFVEKDIQKSRIMLMIPVKDKVAVLNLMRQRANLNPEVEEGGYYSVELPDVPPPVYFRFTDGYLHATIQNRDAMMPNMMLTPAQFFAAEPTSIASVITRIDEVPMDIRKTLLGQMEFAANERHSNSDYDNEIEEESALFTMNVLLSGIKQVLMEGKSLNATFDITPESDEFDVRVKFDAVADSELKKTITGWQNRSSVAGRLSVPKNPLFLEQGNFALSETSQREWAKLVDKVIEKTLADAKDGGERVAIKLAADAIMPTLKAGVLDFGVVATETDQGLNSVLALKVVKGTEIAKTVQTFAAFADKKDAEFEFNIEEVNGVTLHKVTIKNPEFAKVIGTKFVWLGTSDNVLLASIEENGDAIRKAAKGDASSAPIIQAEAGIVRIVELAEKSLPNEPIAAASAKAFGKNGPKGRDTVTITMTGGEKLTLQLKAKGNLARYFYEADQLKNK